MAVWKQLPYEFYEVDAVEAWLDEQVSQGLTLKKRFGRLFCFDRSAPGMTRYRINVLPKKETQSKSERIEAYREMGWEYVTALSYQAEIYRALRPDAVELNTDEEVLAEALQTYKKREVSMGVASGVMILFSVLSTAVPVLNGRLYTYIVYNGAWSSLVCILDLLIVPFVVFSFVQPAVAMRKRKMLARDYHSPAVFARRRRRTTFILGFSAVLFLCALLMYSDHTKSHYLPDGYRPIVTVEDICPAAKVKEVNTFRRESSTEKNISYQQAGPTVLIPSDETPNLYASAFYYTIDHSTLRWEWLAAGYAREKTRGWESVEASGYDGAWYRIGDDQLTEKVETNYQSMILFKGNEVIEIHYHVSDATYAADLHDAIPLLEHK